MRKRERENPCGVCAHYHKHEEGAVCGVCGHRSPSSSEKTATLQFSAFPSEILPEFLYLGSYDNASAPSCSRLWGSPVFLMSPAIVIAYLMKRKGWRLPQSYQWVKEQRPTVELTQAVSEQLQGYEQKIFGSTDNSNSLQPVSFGFPKVNDPVHVPSFNTSFGAPSIFSCPPLNVPSQEFTFGAGQTQKNISKTPFGGNIHNPNGSDIPMDS